MKKYLLAVCLAIWVLAAIGCNSQEFMRDMIELDKALVPALLLTAEKEPTGDAVMAVKQLKQQWRTFTAFRMEDKRDYKEWDRIMAEVERQIDSADGDIDAGDYAGAHKKLVRARNLMKDFRAKNEMDYFPDALASFEPHMQMIAKSVADRVPETLMDDEIRKIGKIQTEARAAWQKVRESHFDNFVFKFSGDRKDELVSYIEQETALLDEIGLSVARRDRAGIINAASLAGEPYKRAVMMFGDFTAQH